MATGTSFVGKLYDISSDIEFEQNLNSHLNQLIIAFFYTNTSQTCENIRADILLLAGEMTSHLFLHVDIENCLTTAKKFDLQSLPSFLIFFNKKLLEKIEASTSDSVAHAIKRRAGELETNGQLFSGPSVPGQSLLSGFLNLRTCECLNDSTEHPFSNLLSLSDSFTETDCDEQLILTLGFNQDVKLHSICFRAPDLKHAPKLVKLFINLNSVDFDFVERAKPVQSIELTEAELSETSVTPLDFLKFQQIQSVTIFIKNNQGSEETTRIAFIGLFGSTKESSNMQEFKRIAGRAGESH